ncbi:hypothetical protein, partial [Kingella kingae]|uniref:hypothetical protein n=1 Tax=Kingella kingae TaxID=504 RepID=UPI001AD80EBF
NLPAWIITPTTSKVYWCAYNAPNSLAMCGNTSTQFCSPAKYVTAMCIQPYFKFLAWKKQNE